MAENKKTKAAREKLPIYGCREQLLDAIKKHQILVIEGETGCGKTTQIAQYLHEGGYTMHGKIACTQPWRVAAMSVATRVAKEMGVKLGHEVGFVVKYEDCTSNRTVIKYMTHGMLLQEFLGEPNLTSYGVIIVDEAHERTVNIDILLGILKTITRSRPDMKLLISSATLDAQKFCNFFNGAPLFHIQGPLFPIEIIYTKVPQANYLEAVVATVLQIHMTQPLGDILAFLPTEKDIKRAKDNLMQQIEGYGSKIGEMVIHLIHEYLPSQHQIEIFEETPKGARKVILATNVVETSLTIDNINYVIDSGFCEQKSYSPWNTADSLVINPISQVVAQQRAGRATCTSMGKCFRLYTKRSFQNDMAKDTIYEIWRTNISHVVLVLKTLGINDPMNFDFIDPPGLQNILRAIVELHTFGALNGHGELTMIGKKIGQYNLF